MFLQVVEKTSPDPEHPFQAWLPCLKLVAQPSAQLLLSRSSLASFAIVDSVPADGVWAAGDGRRDATRFGGSSGLDGAATCSGLDGLATASGLYELATGFGLYDLVTCFGAMTVTPGSGVAPCDSAAPLRLHSNAADKPAMAKGAAKVEHNRMTVSPIPGRACRPHADAITQFSQSFGIRRAWVK